jgi:prepilin-type N-terminal cleavage/methylation domain-containing protein
VSQSAIHAADPARSSERGFSLIETMISLTLLLVVSAGTMEAMLQFSRTQSTVFNRSAMHNGVRSATELLQQEVGQAGRVTLPAAVTLTGPVTANGVNTVGVSSVSNMFFLPSGEGEYLVIDTGINEETVRVTAINVAGKTITADFANTHLANVPVTVRGGFASGVVPTTFTNAGGTLIGSDGYHLKLYGDINDDGNMLYVEYNCRVPPLGAPAGTTGFLYRTVIENAVVPSGTPPTKTAPTASTVLLDNVLRNPPPPGSTTSPPCFAYQEQVVRGTTFVINVAISLTTQTPMVDRTTRQFQFETKALLNVAPRNVFDAWLLASMDVNDRVQPMPPSIAALSPTLAGW